MLCKVYFWRDSNWISLERSLVEDWGSRLRYQNRIDSARMNTSRSINQFVYGYPVELHFDNQFYLEYFVTFDKPNLFIEPYDNLWIKLTATFIFLLGLLGSSVQFSFIVYEACGYAASYRTAINQLVSSSYFVVSCIVRHSVWKHPKVAFEFWYFPPITVLWKLTSLVTLFERKHVLKWTFILSTQNVNAARFDRNGEWDFFCDF